MLSIPDCPNGPIAIERVHAAVRDARVGDVTVEAAIVHEAGDVTAALMHGSPTILIDGRDPFAEPGTVASISCRLYRTESGPQGCPTVNELIEVIRSNDC